MSTKKQKSNVTKSETVAPTNAAHQVEVARSRVRAAKSALKKARKALKEAKHAAKKARKAAGKKSAKPTGKAVSAKVKKTVTSDKPAN